MLDFIDFINYIKSQESNIKGEDEMNKTMKRIHEHKTKIERIARKHADVYANYGNNGVIEINLASDQKDCAKNIISALKGVGYTLTKKGRKFIKILVHLEVAIKNINGIYYSM
jgi:hypothetical protein